MQKKVMPNVKMYRRHMNIFWWVGRWTHIKFIARELTSICVAVYSMVLLFYVWAVLKGPEAFEMFSEAMRSPAVIVLHLLLLGGLLFHSISWFGLAPKAMVIKSGEERVPDMAIVLMNYVGWVLISVLLAWLILGA